MSVEIIAHQDHLVGLRITVIKQVLNLVRPVDRGAVVRDVDRPPPRQGFGEQKHVGRPYPFVFVIVPHWLARRGWQGRARFLGTHLRRDTVIPQWFQASKAAAASDGHAVHC